MPGGRLLGSGFLLALTLIAFLSALGALEAIVGSISDQLRIKSGRNRVIVAVLFVEAAVMLPSSLDPDIVGTLDLIFGSGMQMLGSMIAVVTVAWKIGRLKTKLQIFGSAQAGWHENYFQWLKWAVPGVMMIVLGGYVLSNL